MHMLSCDTRYLFTMIVPDMHNMHMEIAVVARITVISCSN